MRICGCILYFITIFTTNAQDISLFPNCDYSRIELHLLDKSERHSRSKSAFENQTGESRELSTKDVIDFLTILNSVESYGNIVAACHHPMYGLIFYDNKNEPCSYLSLCMGCNNIYTEPILDLGLPYPESGFSNVARKDLRKIFKGWGYPDTGFQVMFDDEEQYRIYLNNRDIDSLEIENRIKEFLRDYD